MTRNTRQSVDAFLNLIGPEWSSLFDIVLTRWEGIYRLRVSCVMWTTGAEQLILYHAGQQVGPRSFPS